MRVRRTDGDLGFNGHPTVETPNIDKLAYGGKILSSWYSGCPVCSGSRAALMTGRQFNRMGVPGVFGPDVTAGLPLNEVSHSSPYISCFNIGPHLISDMQVN